MQTLYTSEPLASRLLIYCRERFPLSTYGLMSAIFAFAGLSLASSMRSGHVELSVLPTIGAVLVTLAIFFQLRVLDEYKDRENDALYLPERPVPRGLISFRELFILAFLLALVQLAVCLWAGLYPLMVLLCTWLYMYLMTREFFAPEYLRQKPLLYMFSHMFIMLFIDLLITSFDFGRTGHIPPLLCLFFVASFFNGIAVELGRKIFAPQNQRTGIVSYSQMLGLKPAFLALFVAIAVSQTCLSFACQATHFKCGFFLIFLAFDSLFLFFSIRALSSYESAAKDNFVIEKTASNLANLAVLTGYLLVILKG